jgi:hypothetical protein
MSLKHSRLKRTTTAALALTILMPALAPAVPAAPQQGRGQQGRPGGAVDQELAETLQQLMMVRLKRALELTPEQEETVVPLMQDLTRHRREDQQLRREGLRSLAALSQDSMASEEILRDRLDSFYADQAASLKAQMEILTALRAELTPRQEARMLAFEERFRSDIRDRMQDARQQRQRARPQGDRPDAGDR